MVSRNLCLQSITCSSCKHTFSGLVKMSNKLALQSIDKSNLYRRRKEEKTNKSNLGDYEGFEELDEVLSNLSFANKTQSGSVVPSIQYTTLADVQKQLASKPPRFPENGPQVDKFRLHQ